MKMQKMKNNIIKSILNAAANLICDYPAEKTRKENLRDQMAAREADFRKRFEATQHKAAQEGDDEEGVSIMNNVVTIDVKVNGIEEANKKLDELIAKIEEVQTRAGELAHMTGNIKFDLN